MQENFKKFQQTNQTPCMQDPLYQLLGDGTTDFINRVLDSTFTSSDNTNQYTQELFQALKQLRL